MKKSIYILLIFLGAVSCAKLDESPESLITSDQFYNTKEDAIAAVSSIYNHLNHNTSGDHASIYNRLLTLAVEMSSDDNLAGNGATNPNVRSLAALTHSASNNRIEELWKQLYETVNRANIAIARIPAIKADTTVTNRLVREAKFLRALSYFNLVRLWGDVPLVINETASLENLNISRTPSDEVYNQIIADLKDAELLPVSYDASDAGRATSGAAKALLASVYITRSEWALGLSKITELQKAPYTYDLFENFADVFNVATKNGKEHIFSVQFKGNASNNGNVLAVAAAPAIVPGIIGWDADAPNTGLYELFKATDKRRAVTFVTSLVSPKDGKTYTFGPRFNKYWDAASISDLSQSSVNIPVIRYAEILLFQAEAINEISGPVKEAYDAINLVRKRAGLDDLTGGLNKDDFRDSVYLERRLEFVFEEKRWFDLIRTKRLISQLNAFGKSNVAEKHYLLPVPQRELDLNPNLKPQNPGWE